MGAVRLALQQPVFVRARVYAPGGDGDCDIALAVELDRRPPNELYEMMFYWPLSGLF